MLDFTSGFTTTGPISISYAGTGGQLSVTNSSDSDRGFIARTATGKIQVGTNSSVYDMELVIDGIGRAKLDTAGNLLMITAAGLGYGAGSGGTVTQATSKSTAVTLNKPTGQITMNAAALASGTGVAFTLNNSLLAATDVLVVSANFATRLYTAAVRDISAGAATIIVTQNSGASQSDAVVINFAIIKGATA